MVFAEGVITRAYGCFQPCCSAPGATHEHIILLGDVYQADYGRLLGLIPYL